MRNTDFSLWWTSFNNDRVIESNHFHFILILKGSVNVIDSESTRHFTKNQFFSINSVDERVMISSNEESLGYVFSVSWDTLIDIVGHFYNLNCSSTNVTSAQAKLLVNDFVQLSRNVGNYPDSLLVESSLLKFIYDLKNVNIPNEVLDSHSKYAMRVREIKLYLHKNFSESINLSDLAMELFLTPQYLSKFIKTHFKETFQSLLTNIRLNKATELLRHDTISITKVAYNCGFSNLQSFNNSFKKKYGVTPSRYRVQNFRNLVTTSNQKPIVNHSINDEFARSTLEDFSSHVQNREFILSNLFDVDEHVLAQKSTPLPKSWQEIINLGFANDVLSSTFEGHIKFIQEELHFKFGRIQGIHDKEFIPYIEESHLFNFVNLYRVIDFMYSINLIPFIEMGDKPKKINLEMNKYVFKSEMQSTYRNIDEWKYFLEQFVVNCVNRYGIEEFSKWTFELWLPHEISLTYSEETIKSYIEHYKILYNALKSQSPDIRLGGMGFNAIASKQVIRQVVENLNSYAIRFDFFSFVLFFVVDDENGIPNLTSDPFYLSNVIKQIKDQISPYRIPFVLSEYTFDVSSRNFMHDSVFQALFVIENILKNYNHLVGMGFWNLTDLTSEYRDINKPFFGGNGMITVDGIPKPVFYAYRFLSTLGNNVLSQSNHHILTSKGAGSYQLLVYNYIHPSVLAIHKYNDELSPENTNELFEAQGEKTFCIRLSSLLPGKYRIKMYMLNKDHGSAIDQWCELGVDNPLGSSEISYIKSKSEPYQKIKYQIVSDELRIEGTIMPNEVILYRVRHEI